MLIWSFYTGLKSSSELLESGDKGEWRQSTKFKPFLMDLPVRCTILGIKMKWFDMGTNVEETYKPSQKSLKAYWIYMFAASNLLYTLFNLSLKFKNDVHD